MPGENLLLIQNMATIHLFPPKASNVEECTMSFRNVLLSVLKWV